MGSGDEREGKEGAVVVNNETVSQKLAPCQALVLRARANAFNLWEEPCMIVSGRQQRVVNLEDDNDSINAMSIQFIGRGKVNESIVRLARELRTGW